MLVVPIMTAAAAVVVNDVTGRKIVYDPVDLPLTSLCGDSREEASADHGLENIVEVRADVLLLHGMTPNGRKCWSLVDHGERNIPQQTSKSVAKHVRKLVEAAEIEAAAMSSGDDAEAAGARRRISALRCILPDRPGYGDSDPACEDIGVVEEAVSRGYSYGDFARDMVRVLVHASGEAEDTNSTSERLLVVLGTSSGGPGALALRNHFLNEMDDCDELRKYYTGGVAGTILCSSDCPYAHPDCPDEILGEDAKDSNGRTKWEYIRDESQKSFRERNRLGWITDYTLERSDWGFNLARPGQEGHALDGDTARRFCSPAVHAYLGGRRDFAGSRLCGPFLAELIGGDATLEEMLDQDHFYASRKPAVLARMVVKAIAQHLR